MQDLVQISKFLSLVLRHRPEKIGIALDENGWADVTELLQKMKVVSVPLDFETLQAVVKNDNKQRYSFSEDLGKIRANQGHSVDVDLQLRPETPLDILFHGTASQNIASILKTGLDKRKRHHVHLSADVQTAEKVGARHGKVVVLQVLAGEMQRAGYTFFRSENGVWLTEAVPVMFLSLK